MYYSKYFLIQYSLIKKRNCKTLEFLNDSHEQLMQPKKQFLSDSFKVFFEHYAGLDTIETSTKAAKIRSNVVGNINVMAKIQITQVVILLSILVRL